MGNDTSTAADRQLILRQLIDGGAAAVIRMQETEKLKRVIKSLHAGGISTVEITMTVPNALEAIRDVTQSMSRELLVGVGSVIDAPSAEAAIDAGARYVVSPVFKPEVIEEAHVHGVPAIPGAMSPTEIQHAFEAGADIIKVFPADIMGMGYLRSVQAPLPHLKLMPSGGVTLDNAGQWLRAGACMVGIGSALMDRTAIKQGDWERLTENARALRRNIDRARTAA